MVLAFVTHLKLYLYQLILPYLSSLASSNSFKKSVAIHKSVRKEGTAMMIAVEILGAIASALTIFSVGVAVGKFLEQCKNDRH